MLEFKIKPSSALKKAVATISLMADEAAICYSPNGIYLEAIANQGAYLERIVAILRINVATADYFKCDVVGVAELESRELSRALDTVDTAEWSVTFFSDNEDDVVPLVFHSARIGGFRCDDVQLLRSYPGEINDPNEILAVKYRSVVGIPSLEFIRIFTHFFFHGDIVQVAMTQKRVTFSSDDEKIVLKKKYEQCIIGGVDYEITFSIDLVFLPLLLNAATQTPTVWILEASKAGDPVMLNIPIGSFLGNLMLYFC